MVVLENLVHRVVQAPMAGTSTPELAVTVCKAGGLGFVALGALDAEGAGKAIRAVRQGTDRPFGVNLFCHAPARRNAGREAAWRSRRQVGQVHLAMGGSRFALDMADPLWAKSQI